MGLKQQIDQDIKEAMKAKDQATLLALRAVKSAILLAETSEGHQGDLSEEEEIKLLQRQVKQRRDSMEQFRANGREDLAVKEQGEISVIEKYLPRQLTREELETEVKAIITQVGATSKADFGKVMGIASKKLSGVADGKAISELVRQLLP